jgi:hypothetical protein
MSSRLGNSAIVFGVIILFAGLCVLPTAFGKNPDPSLLAVGASLFAMGAVIIAGGIYIKARSLQMSNAAANIVQAPSIARKPRGGCDLCGPEAPVIFCKVHQLHMCGLCLDKHYDLRSCIYIPTSRKPMNKPGKPGQAKARGA